MAMTEMTHSAAERYDDALRWGRMRRHKRLPPDCPVPQPSSAWPEENVALLQRYQDWLWSSGTSRDVIEHVYIPMAGYALGLNLKPHSQIDLDLDLEKAMDYTRAKLSSAQWIKTCGNALIKFRRFLRQQRGQIEITLRPVNYERYCTGLPDWLVEQLERYQHLAQRNWRPARLNQQITRFWSGHTRLWRWLFERYPISSLADIRRQYILDYIDHRLTTGHSARGVNQDLRYFHIFLLHLQDQEYHIPPALLRIRGLKEPDRLPLFLTDEQVRLLRDDFEQRVAQATVFAQQRNALLDRAAFYLLWQGGLRLSEVEELRLEDLDLPGRKLMVRQGKGRKDRAVYLTDTAVQALHTYLDVRGMGPTEHVFLYRNRALRKDLIPDRIRAASRRTGVKVTSHRLRHTFATQLLNAGCQVTSIQKLLGHKRLNTTMIYARAHDHTVARDYYTAMAKIERRLDPSPSSGQVPDAEQVPVARADNAGEPVSVDERTRLLALADRLAEPLLSLEARLVLVEQMRCVLNHTEDSAMARAPQQMDIDAAA
jgi:site-specific recombinase XerD